MKKIRDILRKTQETQKKNYATILRNQGEVIETVTYVCLFDEQKDPNEHSQNLSPVAEGPETKQNRKKKRLYENMKTTNCTSASETIRKKN